MHVEDMGDQVRNNRRARATLRQGVAIACDLGENRGDVWIQGEVLVFDEEPPNTPEMNRGEEVLEIQVEYPSAVAMLLCVRDNRPFTLETMYDMVFLRLCKIDLVETILQQDGKLLLQ